jgi:hypothetical protein
MNKRSLLRYHNAVLVLSPEFPTNLIIIQFNSYLFMCKLNSTEANYKVSTGTEEEKIHIQRKYKKQGN